MRYSTYISTIHGNLLNKIVIVCLFYDFKKLFFCSYVLIFHCKFVRLKDG